MEYLNLVIELKSTLLVLW